MPHELNQIAAVSRRPDLDYLPEGQLIELVPLYEVFLNGGDYLDDEERAALHESIREGIEDMQGGRTVDAKTAIAELRSRL